jgi:hypothetical protein
VNIGHEFAKVRTVVGTPILVVLGLVALVAIVEIAASRLATSGAPACAETPRGDLRAGDNPRWRLEQADAADKLLLVLDHQVRDTRHDTASVDVIALARAGDSGSRELPSNTEVGAAPTGTPRASEPLPFALITTARVANDGRSVLVEACTERPDRDSKAGRYKGRVRVAGAGVEPVDLPVEITIRAGVRSTLWLAIAAAALGVALTHVGTPIQPNVTTKKVATAIGILAGIVAGLAAAYLAYDADPTWGAERAQDTVTLFLAAVAAASGAMSGAGAGVKAFDAIRPGPR